MRKILNVAEKASAAKEAALFLANGQQKLVQGVSKYNPIYQFKYRLTDTPDDMLFTSVAGHIMNFEFSEDYKIWQKVSPEVLFKEAIVRRAISTDKAQVVQNLQNLAKMCEMLILWLDCDREGEAIAFEVIDLCREVNKDIEIRRAQFSAITQKDIQRAIQNLKDPNKFLAEAVEGRQEIDLRVGAAFTRFQTLLLKPRFKDISSAPISYGPCQFPTLGFVVDRWMKINEFVPETFWTLNCKHDHKSIEGKKITVEFSWSKSRVFEEAAANELYKKCKEKDEAVVISVQSAEKTRWRPLPLSTIEFQKLVSKKLRITSHRAMEIAEKLYTKGYISYPRTETDSFTKTIDIKGLLEAQALHSDWGSYARRLADQFQWPRSGGKDDKAHPPIHPVKLLDEDDVVGLHLSEIDYKVYELITRHFLACCSKDAKGFETVVKIDIAGEEFKANGLVIKELNWYEIYPYEKWNAQYLPEYTQGQVFKPSKLELKKSQTTPPQLLSESELISLMDKNGIGTDATIHEHIKTIQDRGYAQKQKNGAFEPTKLGIALVSAYKEMGIDLWKPDLRAKMEKDMTAIAKGELSKANFLNETLNELENIYLQVKGKKKVMLDIVGTYFKPTQKIESDLSVDGPQTKITSDIELECGNCETKTMRLYNVEGSGRMLMCSQCESDLSVPQKGEITPLDSKCPICSYQVLRIKNESGYYYTVCPWCFNNPPEQPETEESELKSSGEANISPKYEERLLCFKCTHKTCQHAKGNQQRQEESKIMPCASCKTNDMVVRRAKRFKTLFLGCTGYPTCNNIIGISSKIEHIEAIGEKCDKCKVGGLVKLTVKGADSLELEELKARLSTEEGNKFCLAGCDSHILAQLKYTYDYNAALKGEPEKKTTESKGKKTAEPKEKKTAESKEKKTTESKEKKTAEPEGKKEQSDDSVKPKARKSKLSEKKQSAEDQ